MHTGATAAGERSMFNEWIADLGEAFIGHRLLNLFPIAPKRTLYNHIRGAHRTSRLPFTVVLDRVTALLPSAWQVLQPQPSPPLPTREQVAGLLRQAKRSGPLCALVRGGMLGIEDDEAAVAYAKQVDKLSALARRRWRRGDVNGLKEVLLAAPLLREPYWTFRGEDLRQSLVQARNLDDLQPIMGCLKYKMFLSSLALFDLCSSARFFAGFQMVPTFLLIAPRLKPGLRHVREDGGVQHFEPRKPHRGFRDAADTPLHLFVELVTALCMFAESNSRSWSCGAPSASDMHRIFGGNGSVDPKELNKLRYGEKRFSVRDLRRLLGKRCHPQFEVLLFVALAWEAVLVQREGGKASKPVSVIQPDGDYLAMWRMHKADLRGEDCAAHVGAVPWPHYFLDRGDEWKFWPAGPRPPEPPELFALSTRD